VRAAMQARLEAAVAEADARAGALRDAREKNVHFSARVVALNSRVAALQKAGREAAGREAALAADVERLQHARRAAAAGAGEPAAPAENGAPAAAAPAPAACAPPVAFAPAVLLENICWAVHLQHCTPGTA